MLKVLVAVYSEEEILFHRNRNLSIPDESLIYVCRCPLENMYNKFKVIIQDGDGIYNALNNGISEIKNTADAYIVCGSDDIIHFDVCARVWSKTSAYVTGAFLVGDTGASHMAKRWLLTDAHKSIISEHSVGTIFPIELHDRFGLYDETYRIAGDADFILKLAKNGIFPVSLDENFGRYAITGLSQTQFELGQKELRKAMGRYFKLHALIFSIFSKYREIKK